jgi:hypothetical protein
LSGSNILQDDFSFVLYIIQLVLGGFSAFFAILLWSKSRDFVVVSLILAVLTMYAGLIYKILVKFGFILEERFLIFGIPFLTLFFTIIPFVFLLIALINLFIKFNK